MTESPRPNLPRSILLRRSGAYLLDIVLLFIVLGPFGFAMQQFIGWQPQTGPEIWLTLLVNFSLPVWLYFMLCESSAQAATIGKRLLGLRVGRTDASPPAWPRILLRTAIKLLPWELIHIASFAMSPADGRFTILQATLLTLAWLLMFVYLFWAWRSHGRSSPHDRLAGTCVVPMEERGQPQ